MPTSKSRKLINNEIDYNEFLEDQFKRLFSSYTLAFNKQQKRTGSIFQKRFKRISIRSNVKLLNMIAYIHHNPIHHKFRRSYHEWDYSTYNVLILDLSSWIAKEEAYALFVNKRSKATELLQIFHKDFKSDMRARKNLQIL